MNTAIQCIIFLACAVTCSSTTIVDCRCLKTSKSVKLSLILDVVVFNPRPHCSKKEVIVKYKNKTSECLQPDTKYTNAVLRTIQKQKADLAAKMNATSLKTSTEPATVSETVSATVSATASAIIMATAS
ncbi:interleukin-8-like [Epinephelus fuscoguttatus]|uniref:interleukin-8-like n=1 Tax=Epinephelus fuscoguttatus TaxID=293821 RepID=UPI0020D001B8|nr:interleukin-8-like [Epinephelus fuscoguttatus]